jgi:RNA polymerase-interacting CarD/CdnL/TRCF family regulator
MDSNIPYSVDDWIVHSYYGVGQIKRIEVKPIHGKDTSCFKVKTKDSTFWFPATDDDNPRIRPIGSKDIIHKVIKYLRRKSNKLDVDRKYWKERISEVQSDGDLISMSLLVRDLSAQQVLRNLNQTETDALEKFKERLVREWASITKEKVDNLRSELHDYIQESQAKVKVD